MKQGPSDLHMKILDNMDAEVQSIEKDMDNLHQKHKGLKPEDQGFIFKLKKLFSGK